MAVTELPSESDPARNLSMIVYGLQDLRGSNDLSDRGWTPGPVQLLQRSGLPHLADERSDRSRVLWPHVFDVLHARGRRWHLGPDGVGALEELLGFGSDALIGVEALFFLGASDEPDQRELTQALDGLRSGTRGEVTAGLVALHVARPARDLRRFQSRAAQDLHADVARAVSDVGRIGMDRVDDAMHASELPFVVCAAVSASVPPPVAAISGRRLEDARQFASTGWSVATWQDLLVMCAQEERIPYWPRDRSPEAALAGVGDVVLMRVLQRYGLQMLATRVGSARPGEALGLQRVAHQLRSRLWWNGLSGDPLVAQAADDLADIWDLPDLAAEAFAGLEALAARDGLDATRSQMEEMARQSRQVAEQTEQVAQQTREATALSREAALQTKEAAKLSTQAETLNLLLFLFAALSLALATLTFVLDVTSDAVEARLRVVLLVALAVVLAVAGVTGTKRARRLRGSS